LSHWFSSISVLLCGCLPFDDDSACIPNDDIVKAKFQLRYPRWAKNLSPSAKDLLSHLLDVDPARRYTAEEALEHPWVRGDTAPKDNVLASPKQMKKSPVILMGSAKANRYSGGRRKVPVDVKFSPPTPQGSMARKTSI
jgi:serine/threonine-protein kinase RCK2